jgi:long-chain acyl-CoA synthetase
MFSLGYWNEIMRREIYPPGVPFEINYPQIPLYSFLANSARKYPNREALLFMGSGMNYLYLWDRAKRFGEGIRKQGLKVGDRVALLMPNIPQYLITFYGLLAAGGIGVALNPLTPPEEIARGMEITDAKFVIALDRFLDKIPQGIRSRVILVDGARYAPLHLRLLNKIKKYDVRGQDDILKLSDMLNAPPLEEFTNVDVKEDVAFILFTGGTTGKPKGVMLTHYNLVVNALQSCHWTKGWGYSAKPQLRGWPIVLCAVPFFHSYGMVVMNESVQFGCTMVLEPNPSALKMMSLIERNHVTHFPAIPRFIRDILEHPKIDRFNLTSLTHCATGGAFIPQDHIEHFEEISGSKFYQGYGLTEAGPSTHATPIGIEPKHGSVGLPYPDTDFMIVDTKLGEVEIPPGKPGEIVVKGPQIMKGYWKDPDTTAKVLRDGWLYTGDIGMVDEEGYLYVLGRKEEKILARGRTIWPSIVETALKSHPTIDEAAVIGIPDPLRCSTDLRGLVVPKEGREIGEKEIMDYCRKVLEPYQIPSKIEFVDSIPLTPMGKVDFIKLKDMLEQDIKRFLEEMDEDTNLFSL